MKKVILAILFLGFSTLAFAQVNAIYQFEASNGTTYYGFSQSLPDSLTGEARDSSMIETGQNLANNLPVGEYDVYYVNCPGADVCYFRVFIWRKENQ